MPQIIAALRKCRPKGGLQKQKPMQVPRCALCPFALVVSLSVPPFLSLSLSIASFLVVGVWSVASVTDERQLLKMHEKHKLIFYPHFRCN